jgi:hypothetical protein
MRSTYEELPVGTRPTRFRVVISLLNIFAGLALVAALGAQVVDQSVNNRFGEGNYFAYISIQVSVAGIIVLLAGGIYGLKSALDTRILAIVRANFAAFSLLIVAAHSTLLTLVGRDDRIYVGDLQWAETITEIIVPTFVILEWMINPYRPRVPRWTPLIGLAYPIIWLAATLVRGSITDWYPYDLSALAWDSGWVASSLYFGTLGLALLLIFLLVMMANRIHYRLLPRNKFES